jgi:threonine/homoserine/homoserine lactone efflux protein
VHVLAAALGLSAILATSAITFSVVKYVGAAYLVYLGIQALRSKGETFDIATNRGAQITAWKAFRQGALVDILNPKAAIFFMAFLPQFIRPELGHNSAQIFMLGVLVIVVAIPVELFVVLTADRTTNYFRKNRRFSIWLDRVLGSVLIGLGLRLALAENNNA